MVKILLKRVGKVKAKQLTADIAKITRIAIAVQAKQAPHIEIFSRNELVGREKRTAFADFEIKQKHTNRIPK